MKKKKLKIVLPGQIKSISLKEALDKIRQQMADLHVTLMKKVTKK